MAVRIAGRGVTSLWRVGGISNPKTVLAGAGVILAPKVSIDGVKKRDDDEEEPHG
ncbi:MAG TPA: hypothetical protein VMS99_17010 [Acidimicrobiia bacterium]|nr:hypothetical protein [Acidimicrobiia bacterium]